MEDVFSFSYQIALLEVAILMMKNYLYYLCPKEFDSPDSLSRHITSCHEQSKIVCEQCGKDFSRLDSLKRHTANCKADKGKNNNILYFKYSFLIYILMFYRL